MRANTRFTSSIAPHWFWLVMLIFVDQIVKAWFMHQGKGVLNQGGVFGLLPGDGWLFVLLALWLLLTGFYLRNQGETRQWLLFVIAGGASNILDRFFFQGVRDMIYYPIFRFYGNIADIYICFGSLMLMIRSGNVHEKH